MNERNPSPPCRRAEREFIAKSPPLRRDSFGRGGRWWLRPWLPALVLLVVTVVLYCPATRCDFVNYDDPDYVTSNHRVLGGLTAHNVLWAFTTGHANNWHPLTWLSLMLDASVYGESAAGFHFTNLAWHAVNAGLLYWLLRRLTGATGRSFLVAALFAWHPAHVESVAWVTERKDVLSLGFGLLTLLCYAGYAQGRELGRAGGQRPGHYYALALLFFALGLMSKPMLVTWPFVLLLLDYWPLARWKPGGTLALVWEKIPFLALAAAASLVTVLVQERALGRAESIAPGMRVGNAVISYARYLEKLVWPANLAVIYPHPGYWPLAKVLLAGFFLAGVSAVAWLNRRRQPYLLAGWLWYVGTLVPVIGLVQVGSQAMADRYTYIPSIGVLVMLVWGAGAVASRWRLPGAVWPAAGAVALVLCLAVTRHQLGYWRDSETLFRHALAVTKDNFIAHTNLASTLLDQNRTEAAMDEIKEALRLNPAFPEGAYDYGLALEQEGLTKAALREYQRAISLKPDYAEAHNNLGRAFDTLGQKASAVSEYQQAMRLNPDLADPHNNLGILLAKESQTDEAVRELEEAIRLKPDYAVAHNNLGIVLGASGRVEEALVQFQAAVRLKPDFANAQRNLAMALALKNQAKPGAAAP